MGLACRARDISIVLKKLSGELICRMRVEIEGSMLCIQEELKRQYDNMSTYTLIWRGHKLEWYNTPKMVGLVEDEEITVIRSRPSIITISSSEEEESSIYRKWDIEKGEEERIIYEGFIISVIENMVIISKGYDSEEAVEVYNIETREIVVRFGKKGNILQDVEYSESKSIVILGYREGNIEVRDIKDWSLIKILEAKRERNIRYDGSSLAITKEGGYVVSSHAYSFIRLWDVERGEDIWTSERYRENILSLKFTEDGKRIGAGMWNGNILIIDSMNGKELLRIDAHKGQVNSIAFTHEGKHIISGGSDRSTRIWSMEGEYVWEMPERNSTVYELSLSRDGMFLAIGSRDREVVLFRLKSDTYKRWECVNILNNPRVNKIIQY